MNDDRILHPLRLAKGSHHAGSGKGCAMNVISYINGDKKITDYPACSAVPLARMVQVLNDYLADPMDGFLSPKDSVTVLDLGWLTVGTEVDYEDFMYHWAAGVMCHDAIPYPILGARCRKDYVRNFAMELLKITDPKPPWRFATGLVSPFNPHNGEDQMLARMCTSSLGALREFAGTTTTMVCQLRRKQAAEFVYDAIMLWRELAALDDNAPLQQSTVDLAVARM